MTALAGLAMCSSSSQGETVHPLDAEGDAALDRLVLVDGRELIGRVLDTNAVNGEVVLEITAGSLVTTIDVPVSSISEIQEDAVSRALYEHTTAVRDTKASPSSDREAQSPATRFIAVPIEGRIGIDAHDLDRPAVAAAAVEVVLRNAVHRGIDHVVFIIDSPGGHVTEARAIAESMSTYSDELTYHAVVKRSLSAAMWVTLGCDTVHVHEDATIGGALTYINTGAAPQYDAKINGIVAAELASLAHANGRCPDTVREMVEPTDGRVLTVTSEDAIATGLADGYVSGLDELGSILGFESWNSHSRLGESAIRQAHRKLVIDERKRQRRAERLFDEIEQAAHAADRIPAAVSLARQVEPRGSRAKPNEVQLAIRYWRDVLREADSIGDAYRDAKDGLERLEDARVDPVFLVNVSRDRERLQELIDRLDRARLQVEGANADAEAAIVRLRRLL